MNELLKHIEQRLAFLERFNDDFSQGRIGELLLLRDKIQELNK